jgi:hypothetical protein
LVFVLGKRLFYRRNEGRFHTWGDYLRAYSIVEVSLIRFGSVQQAGVGDQQVAGEGDMAENMR